MGTIWLWVCASGVLLQLVSQRYSLELSGSTYVFVANEDLLYAAGHSQSYSILLWVKMQIQPTASMVFLSLEKSSSVVLSVSKETSGNFVVTAKSACGGIVSTTHTGPITPEWVHLGVVVDSRGPALTLAITMWGSQSTSFTSTPNIETFEAFNSTDMTLTLGNASFTVVLFRGKYWIWCSRTIH